MAEARSSPPTRSPPATSTPAQWGVATQSKFLAVGSVVPWAEPRVGAIATQAYANPRYGPDGLALLREGLCAEEVVERLTAADDGRDHRQLGVVDGRGRQRDLHRLATAWTGRAASPGRASRRRETSSSARRRSPRSPTTFAATAGRPLAERLLECLAAAQAAGGDRRGQQSAALLVVERDGGYAGLSDVARRPARRRPRRSRSRSSRGCTTLHELLFGKTPRRDSGSTSTTSCAAELRERLARSATTASSRRAFARWAGTENLEERVDGVERIDPVVLEELRAR